ncbi:MAG TPA: choice-of-anchor Q domain-containing protein [Verrucomicrobiae bacterium]|nr:choice-of-anchor Q domain-containing protein [Verrucomicrobiae bacterium]
MKTKTLFLLPALIVACAGSALAGVHYVDVNSTNATPPYTNWATAATNIQDAVDAAVAGDEVVVTNGVYQPISVGKPLSVRSVNGPKPTIIDGGGLVRCAYLTNSATLSGFSLNNGYVNVASGPAGAGVFCASHTVLVSDCVLSSNQAYQYIPRVGEFPGGEGGGAYGGTLDNCTLTGNLAGDGGGAAGCTLNNCTLTNNQAAVRDDYCGCVLFARGGGAYYCTLNNCTLIDNWARADMFKSFRWDEVYLYGGGAYACTLNNCTLTRNRASVDPTGLGVGRAYGGGASECALNNCILYFNTAPFGANYDDCTLNYSCTAPFPASGGGNITNDPLFVDQASGNLRLQSNSPCINVGNNSYVTNATDLDGNPRIVRGIVDIGAYESQDGVHYVDVNSINATPPYTNWTTAATNIQDAVDAAVAGDEIVVTNGVYATGEATNGFGRSRVVVDKPLNVRSVNGPQFTTIEGSPWRNARCAYLTNGANLSGFALTNGFNLYWFAQGGGVYGGTLNNCVLTGNTALFGGGAYGGTLNNCTLTGNGAEDYGGGAAFCTLNNCTLTGNGAGDIGGGAYGCTLKNCILFSNAPDGDGGSPGSLVGNNWIGDPLFADTNGWANQRLQPNSPCINAGNNSYATNATDLEGNPRIAGGTVDLGAYEYQWPQLTIVPSWPNVFLTWPTNNAGYDYTGFTLQSTTNLSSPSVWSTNALSPTVVNDRYTVTNPVSEAQEFFRLVH